MIAQDRVRLQHVSAPVWMIMPSQERRWDDMMVCVLSGEGCDGGGCGGEYRRDLSHREEGGCGAEDGHGGEGNQQGGLRGQDG